MNQPTQVPPTQTDRHKPIVEVAILVNGKPVTVPKRVTGAEIEAAAKVPPDFDLFRVHGRKEIPIADDEHLTVEDGERFIASPTLDPSFVAHPVQVSAVASLRDTFPEHIVDIEQAGDGTALVVLRAIGIGEVWNFPVIDLSVKLQITFPSTPPYPFYGPPGMARVDGGPALNQVQPQVLVDGALQTQISLTKPFDPATETLGSRVATVVRWLRSPR
jgi:hypothetical protein